MPKLVVALSVFIGLFLVAATASTAIAQVPAAACPKLTMTPADGSTSEGKRELLMATLTGGTAGVKPEFKWSSNGGKGEMGTTPGIAWLDTSGVPVGTSIRVEVEVVGYGCVLKGSTTIKMVPRGPCPNVTVYSPDSTDAGMPLTMTANVGLGDPNVTPTFNWTISNGTISSGQGTSSITIDTHGAQGSITGTVDVGGYQRQCSTSASSTTSVAVRAQARMFDQFPAMIRTEDQYARLDNFAIEMQNDPTSKAILMLYAGRTSRKGAIEALSDQTIKYLTATRGVDPKRIQVVNGGFRENGVIDVYLVPLGAPDPTAQPTVDPSEARQLPPLKKKP